MSNLQALLIAGAILTVGHIPGGAVMMAVAGIVEGLRFVLVLRGVISK